MLAQLLASIEPLILNYGLFLAMGFVVVILVPVSLWWVLRSSGNRVAYADITQAYDHLAELRKQMNAWESLLRQQLNQKQTFKGKTLKEAEALASLQNQALETLKVLFSRHKQVEQMWSQEQAGAPAETERLEEDFQELQQNTQPALQWYKQLSQRLVKTRTRLHEFQQRLESLDGAQPVLLKQLQMLQGNPFANDPICYFEEVLHFKAQLEKAELAERRLPPLPEPASELPVVEPVPEPPVPEPASELPAAAPVPELPQAEPASELPAAGPVPEPPVAEPASELPAAEPVPEPPVADQAATRKVSRQRFARTEAVMKTLQARVQAIAEMDRELGASFHFSAWRRHIESLEQAKYALKTSETLLLMAYRLEKTPQAAPHRVKLSLKRCEDRLLDVENIYQMLSEHQRELQQRHQQAETLLQSLTEDLKQYQAQWSPADLKDHADHLLQVRQGLAHPPISLQDIEARLAQLKKEQSEKSKAYG